MVNRPGGRWFPARGGPAARPNCQSPPQVIRGAKLHQAFRVHIGADWIRATGPESRRADAEKWMRGHFGRLKRVPGKNFYRDGLASESGAVLWFDPYYNDSGGQAHCTIQIPGELLGMCGSGFAVKALGDLRRLGFHFTRVDLALDFRGEGLDLVGAMEAGCQRGELCSARRFKSIPEFSNRGELLGHTLYIGRRGKDGSGRLVRAYDKGLESGTVPAGQWHRLEVEFTGDCADNVASLLIQADRVQDESEFILVEAENVSAFVGWRRQAVELVLGSIDFREWNGSRALSRRGRSGFWCEVLSDIEPECVREQRESRPSLERTARWAVRCVTPRLRMLSQVSGRSIVEVLSDLEQIIGEQSKNGGTGVLGEQYVGWLESFPGGVEQCEYRGAPSPEFREWINANRG